jgi:peptidoglycan/LPS O-acetylase OafA/YrhL
MYIISLYCGSSAATLMVASLSYFLMEKPLLNLKDRFFSTQQTKTGA